MEITDSRIILHLAKVVRNFENDAVKRNARGGLLFEQQLFERTVEQFEWTQVCGPDQFNLGLPIMSKTGTLYEFDGCYFDNEKLYITEVKRLSGNLTREHVSLFIMKLMDLLLGAYEDIEHLTIKPILISSSARIDQSAYLFAISWGILLVSHLAPTPFELAADLYQQPTLDSYTQTQLWEYERLSNTLWRPMNTIFSFDKYDKTKVCINMDGILNRLETLSIWEQWMESVANHTGLE